MIKAKDPYAGRDPAWGFLPRPALCANLVGAFDLSQGLERAVINQAGGPPARVIGTPTVGANYLRFSGGACLETEVLDRDEVCIVAVSRLPNPPVNGAIVVGTYLNGTDDGTSLYFNSAGRTAWSANTATTLNTSTRDTTGTYADWWINVVSAIYDGGLSQTVINQRAYSTSLQSTNLNPVSSPRKPAYRKFRIGDDYSATFQDAVDVAALFIVAGLGAYDTPALALKDAFAADVAAWCAAASISLG